MLPVSLREIGIVGTGGLGLDSHMRAPRRSIPPPRSSLMVPPVFNSRRTVTPMGVQGCTHERSSSSQKTPMRMMRLTS